MSTPQESELLALRRELIDVTAGQMALIEYVCCLAETTLGLKTQEGQESVKAQEVWTLILGLTQKHRQSLLETIEGRDPAFAALLDIRSQDDVSYGLDSP